MEVTLYHNQDSSLDRPEYITIKYVKGRVIICQQHHTLGVWTMSQKELQEKDIPPLIKLLEESLK